jgi:hypothetical protein
MQMFRIHLDIHPPEWEYNENGIYIYVYNGVVQPLPDYMGYHDMYIYIEIRHAYNATR